MDKRKTQRILGILVIIALVIILFPLLFSKNEVTTQTANIAPPVFPNQQKAPITTANNIVAQPNENHSAAPENQTTPAADVKEKDIVTPLESDANTTSTMNVTEPVPPQSDEVQESTQADITKDTIPTTAEENTEIKTIDQTNSEDFQKTPAKISSNNKAIEKPEKKPQPVKASQTKKPKPIIRDVAKLNKPAWVIQMGSFKNKDNARSLTDKLRAAGYHAFTKEIKSVKGNLRTRVYIGPEFKEAEATKISQKIQKDLSLPSIVLPYKPLAL